MHLRHTVNGLGSLNSQIGSGISGRLWPESSDCTGHKELEMVLLGELHDVMKSLNVDPNGQRDVVFANCAQQSAEVDQPIDPMRYDDLLQVFEVENIGEDEWAC